MYACMYYLYVYACMYDVFKHACIYTYIRIRIYTYIRIHAYTGGLYLGIASAPGELGPLITDPIPWRTPEQV